MIHVPDSAVSALHGISIERNHVVQVRGLVMPMTKPAGCHFVPILVVVAAAFIFVAVLTDGEALELLPSPSVISLHSAEAAFGKTSFIASTRTYQLGRARFVAT